MKIGEIIWLWDWDPSPIDPSSIGHPPYGKN